jgi:hypothetical protein
MARSLHALRSWLPAAALLGAAACEHKPDVVAQFEANVQAGSSAPAAAGNSASAGMPAAPSNPGNGGTFAVAGNNNTRDDAGVTEDAGEIDAGERADSGTDAAMPEQTCEPDQGYWVIKKIVDDGCVLDPKYFPFVTPFVQQPSVPMGESRHIAACDILGVTFYPDEATGRYVLCPNACDAASKWVDNQQNEVLRCMGLLDAGTSP